MILQQFKLFPKNFLGIDVGTSAVKVVELSGWGERRTLKNYGELKSAVLYGTPFRTFERNTLVLSGKEVARAIDAIIQEGHMRAKKAIFSIPDFSTFFTNFKLPPMTAQELPNAVTFEARRHVPIPLSEVTLDWQVVQKPDSDYRWFNILMAAVPNDVIQQYQTIAKIANLNLVALEAEVFGILRSSVSSEEQGGVIMMDIGAQSTTVSVVTKGTLRISHSFDIAGNTISERIASSLQVSFEEAEKLKMEKGLQLKAGTVELLLPLAESIWRETQKVVRNFREIDDTPIEKMVIAGGTSLLPGLREYFQQHFAEIAGAAENGSQPSVELVQPFRNIFYPSILEETLQKMGPAYAIAAGMALRGFE
ncbi:MAG: type IV pilus assembly protein PilM [Candidatus Wildermuthbacteria bacterium]|nr:type IV pilus assembly protein PilM [Candidatus Wildermuthbacteria bacterium]